MEGPCLVSKERGSLSSPSSLCVSLRDLNSLVIHKAQLPALNQEISFPMPPTWELLSRFKYAQGWIPGRQELCHLSPEGRQLAPPHAPQATAEAFKPVPCSAPCLSLPFDKSEPGRDARARARLVLGFSERLYHECPSLEISAHKRCHGNVSTHWCLLGWDSNSRWRERAGREQSPGNPWEEPED